MTRAEWLTKHHQTQTLLHTEGITMGTLTWEIVDKPNLMDQLEEAIITTAKTGRVVVIHPNGEGLNNLRSKVIQRGYKVKGMVFRTQKVDKDLHAWAEAK